MRFSNKGTIPLLVAGLLATAWCCFASPPPKDAPDPTPGLTVHEWGTFSTFSGSDGENLKFYPYDNDLPEFVHGYLLRNSKEGPTGGTISLETPVLYFYSEHALTASVKVQFPKGTLTEWYPHADRTESTLSWQGVKVLPREEMDFPRETAESRYYAARETDAAPLAISFFENNQRSLEQEKFLFYRGVGSFDMPLSVRAWGDGKFTVHWTGDGPWGDLILVQVKAGKIRFQPFNLDRKGGDWALGDVQVSDHDATKEQLGDAVAKMLMDKGLYEKEARAMVKTWSSAWFGEEGTRVLYILPEKVTDDLLPLEVEPKPAKLLRVLVGRHDVLTPEREKWVDALVAELNRPTTDPSSVPDAKQQAAEKELSKLGRYTEAAWTAAGERLKIRQ